MTAAIVFMGSPDFAVPALHALADSYNVVGIVTQPDRASGRGRTLTPPPVKEAANQLGLPLIQPPTLRHPEALSQLAAWQPDVIVVAAFGQILRKDVLELPQHGCINIHASLLPRWRGAAPIQAAILNGDANTGVTIMRMDAGVDTGPILSQRTETIREEDTAASLSRRLCVLGSELLLETLPGYLSGNIIPQAQDDSLATFAPILKKADGELDFSQPAEYLARQVRAYTPWPGTYLQWEGSILKILRARADKGNIQPQERAVASGLPAIGTPNGLLLLEEVQPAGKKPMPGKAFLAGARGWV